MKTVRITREGVVERDMTPDEEADITASQRRLSDEQGKRQVMELAQRARRIAAFATPSRTAGLDELRTKVAAMSAVLRELHDAES